MKSLRQDHKGGSPYRPPIHPQKSQNRTGAKGDAFGSVFRSKCFYVTKLLRDTKENLRLGGSLF